MSQPQAQQLVIDASIAIKWFLNDEDHVRESLSVLRLYRDGHLGLIAPDHIRYEVANALIVASRMHRLSDHDADQALREFLSWSIPTVGADALITSGSHYSRAFGCAFNDGLYLALADRVGCQFLHADRRLRNTLGGSFGNELGIDDYAPPS